MANNAVNFPSITPFSVERKNWKSWKATFQDYLHLLPDNVPERKKIAFLVTSLGEDAADRLRNALEPRTPSDNLVNGDAQSVVNLLTQLDTLFDIAILIVAERHNFWNHKQREGQSIEDYVAEMHKLAKTCRFEQGMTQQEILRDGFLLGLRSPTILARLLGRGPEMTLDDAIKNAVNIVKAAESAKLMEQGRSEEAPGSASKVQTRKHGKSPRKGSSKKNESNSSMSEGDSDEESSSKKTWTCFRCGKAGHFRMGCPVSAKVKCSLCGQKGHSKKACYNQRNQKLVAEGGESEARFILSPNARSA